MNSSLLSSSSQTLVGNSRNPDEDFEMLEEVGRGAYGSVHKALFKPTGEIVAIKIVPINQDIEVFQKEIKILEECHNDYIVKYYGSYIMAESLWIVMEYCAGGSISDLVRICDRGLKEEEIASILQDILKGLEYLHNNKKIHRDVKAGNILLDQKGSAKLADFGVSAEIATNAQRDTIIGSPYWMSPEMLVESRYDQKTDIWSLGITAIEIAEGRAPYSNIHPYRAMFVIKNNPTKGLTDKGLWSQEFIDLVSCCLKMKSVERPTASELLSHAFITRKSRGKAILAQLFCNSIDAIEKERIKENKKKLHEENEDSLQLKFVEEYRDTIKQQESSIVSFTNAEEEEEEYNSGTIVMNSGSIRAEVAETEFVKFAKKMNEADLAYCNKNEVNQMISGLDRNELKQEVVTPRQEVATPRLETQDELRNGIKELDDECEGELNRVLESYKDKITQKIDLLRNVYNRSVSKEEIKTLGLSVPHLSQMKRLCSYKEIKNINNINSINISINEKKSSGDTRTQRTDCEKESSTSQEAFKKVKKYQQFVEDAEVFEYIKKTYLNKK